MAGDYAKDLEEFSSTFATETNEVFQKVTETAQTIKSKIVEDEVQTKISDTFKRGVDSIKTGLGTLVKEVNIATDDIVKQWNKNFDNGSTLDDESLGDIDEFNEWLIEFDLDERSEEVKEYLKNPVVLDLYQKLVPKDLSPQEFWGRFIYKHELAQEKERKRLSFMKSMQDSIDAGEIGWDDEKEKEEEVVSQVKTESNHNAIEENTISTDELPVENHNEEKVHTEPINENTPEETVHDTEEIVHSEEPSSIEEAQPEVPLPDEKEEVEQTVDIEHAPEDNITPEDPIVEDQPVLEENEPEVTTDEPETTISSPDVSVEKPVSLHVNEDDDDVFEWE